MSYPTLAAVSFSRKTSGVRILVDRETKAPETQDVDKVLENARGFIDRHGETGSCSEELKQCLHKTVKSCLKLVHSIGSAFAPLAISTLSMDDHLYSTLSKCKLFSDNTFW